MAREQYIFETNTINGGFLVDRRTNQIVGTTANGVDQYFVTGDRNPVTGGISLLDNIPLNGLRTTPVRLVTFGDSTAVAASTRSPANQDVSQISSSAWQSGTISLTGKIDRYATHLFYPQAYLVGSGGVAGNNTTQMLARDQSAASVTRYAITDMLNLAPHAVLLRGGSINDILTVTAGTLVSTVSAVYARHVQIINRFLAANVVVLDCGIYGFANGTANTATDLASTLSAIAQLNALFSSYAAQFPTQIRFINPVGVVSDATGAYLNTRISGDGTHLTAYGQYLMAAKEAIELSKLFGSSSNVRYPGLNNISNALMANTSAVAYGTAPTGFTSLTANATRQNAQVEVINGKPFYTCEFVISATSNNGQMLIPFDPTATATGMVAAMNISSSDVWGFEFDFYIAGLNGYSPTPSTISAYVDIRDSVGAGRIVMSGMDVSTTHGLYQSPFTGHIAFPPIVFGDTSANLTTASTFFFQVNTNDASGTLKLGVSNPRIVKLNQSVLTG